VADRAGRRRRVRAFTTAIERLVPGFGREGDMPSREADEPNTVDTLTIKRSGLAVMHVWITNGKSLGGSDGPIHGTPLAIADTTPRWYVADSYFLDHPGSRYQSIPRAEKLALWDAFSASLTRRSRVLGVFPASELRDRTLLTPWGYPASSLSSATVIVSTPEFGSGVEEEVPWSNADELVTNAADYETGNLHDDGDALARLDVTLFVRDGSNWRPVVRMASARGK